MLGVMQRRQAQAQPRQKKDILGPLAAIAGGAATIAAPGAGALAMTAGGAGAAQGLMGLTRKQGAVPQAQDQSRLVQQADNPVTRRQTDLAGQPQNVFKDAMIELQKYPDLSKQYMAPIAQAYMLDLHKRSVG